MKIYQPSTMATIIMLAVMTCALILGQLHATARSEQERLQRAVLLGGVADVPKQK